MKKYILAATTLFVCLVSAMAQDTTYQIKYSYEYDMQKYDYIKRLDYADGTIVRNGDRQVILKGTTYRVVSKDREVNDERRRSVQYTVTDEGGDEYVICFNDENTYSEELRYQVIFFSANSPYHWIYYITDKGK